MIDTIRPAPGGKEQKKSLPPGIEIIYNNALSLQEKLLTTYKQMLITTVVISLNPWYVLSKSHELRRSLDKSH
jgi:hypothetical protein